MPLADCLNDKEMDTPGSATQAGIAYFVLRPHISSGSVSATVLQPGYLGIANNNLSYPAVGVTASGRGVIAFSVMGPDYYPSAGYASLDASVGAGEIHIVAEGLGPEDGFTGYAAFNAAGGGFARWGDYGAAAVDGNARGVALFAASAV